MYCNQRDKKLHIFSALYLEALWAGFCYFLKVTDWFSQLLSLLSKTTFPAIKHLSVMKLIYIFCDASENPASPCSLSSLSQPSCNTSSTTVTLSCLSSIYRRLSNELKKRTWNSVYFFVQSSWLQTWYSFRLQKFSPNDFKLGQSFQL